MKARPKGGILPAVIIVGALVVSASILFAVSSYGPLDGVRIITETETTTSTVSTIAVSSIQLHKVTFNESTCNDDYPYEWAVTLGNITIGQPSNATFPFPRGAVKLGPAGAMISKIVFTVPDGTYNYNISGSIGPIPESGIVNVNGSDVVVPFQAHTIACGLGGGLG